MAAEPWLPLFSPGKGRGKQGRSKGGACWVPSQVRISIPPGNVNNSAAWRLKESDPAVAEQRSSI